VIISMNQMHGGMENDASLKGRKKISNQPEKKILVDWKFSISVRFVPVSWKYYSCRTRVRRTVTGTDQLGASFQ